MTLRAPWIIAAVAAASLSSAARADRVVDYTIDETIAARDAAEQGVALAPLPTRGTTHIAVQIAPGVDHTVLRAGILCSAWKVHNPISTLLQRFLTVWDRDGAPASSLSPTVGCLCRLTGQER